MLANVTSLVYIVRFCIGNTMWHVALAIYMYNILYNNYTLLLLLHYTYSLEVRAKS